MRAVEVDGARRRHGGCGRCAGTCAPTTCGTGPTAFLSALGAPGVRRSRWTNGLAMARRIRTRTGVSVRRHRPRTLARRGGVIARVPQLLVACDYDGTLAPIVDDPGRRHPAARGGRGDPGAGRAAADHGRGRLRPGAAGSGHAVPATQRGAPGRQPRLGVRRRLRRSGSRPEVVELRTRLQRAVERHRPRATPGVRLEPKPASVAVHTRGVRLAQVAADAVPGGAHGPGQPGRTSTSPRASRSSSCR